MLTLTRKTNAGSVTTGDGRTRTFCISSSAIDRDNDALNQRGWVLDNFKKNPICLFGHDYGSFPIGRWDNIRTDGVRTLADLTFADTLEGDTALKLVDAQMLNATSVGFRPIESTRNAQRGGTDYTRQELLEISLVPVPANPDAVIQRAAALGLDAAVVRKMFGSTKGGRAISRANAEHVQAIDRALADIGASHDELRKVTREAAATCRSALSHVEELKRAAGHDDPPDDGNEIAVDLDPQADGTDDKAARYDLDVIADAVKSAYARPLHRRALDLDGGNLIDVDPAEVRAILRETVRRTIRETRREAIKDGTKTAFNQLRGRLD